MGYLVSAPIRPSCAFDIQMLDLVRQLHLRSPPNKTAWTLTVESFLKARGYSFTGQDIMRRKFTTSLKWYTYLCIEVDVTLERVVDMGGKEGKDSVEVDDGDDDWQEDEPDRGLKYLVDCCPQCFGKGEHQESSGCVARVISRR